MKRPGSRYVTALSAAAALSITGCGLFIHGTPMSGVPTQDREVLAEEGGRPQSIRLTRPTTISGFPLATGSVVQADGRDCRIQTAEPLTTSGVTIPARSWLELKKANSIVTGDKYNWNGVVHLGGAQAYGMVQAQEGDRAYFTGSLFSDAKLTQLAIATTREMGGRSLPAGSIIDFREDGRIQETFTPGEQRQLAHERQERQAERARQEQRCKEVCAPVTDFAANARCLGSCRS
jgi:hypothetical protein